MSPGRERPGGRGVPRDPAALQFPAHGGGSQHGGGAAVEAGDEELGLAAEDGEHVLVVGALDGFHQQVARLGESAEEDEGLGRGEDREVGAGAAQHVARELIDALGQRVSLGGGEAHLQRGDVLGLVVAQQGGLVAGLQELSGGACHARGGAVGLQAALPPAAAGAAVLPHHGGVAQLAGEAVATVDHLPVGHDARAHARAQGDVDEVLHAPGHAVGHLAQGGGVGVVGDGDGHPAQRVAEELGQRHHAVVRPGQVGGVLDGAPVVVGVGRADAHGLDGVESAHGLDDGHEGVDGVTHVVFHAVVAAGLDGGGGLDFATGVHDAEHGVGASQVQPDDIGFQQILCHDGMFGF